MSWPRWPANSLMCCASCAPSGFCGSAAEAHSGLAQIG
jgi:hypothetical protein